MSDLLKAIAEDEAEYRRLCRYYDEPPQFTRYHGIDLYGLHADELKERWRVEQFTTSHNGQG